MKATNSVLASYGTTIFEVMSQMAREAGSINLGQGFPEGELPTDVIAKAAEALTSMSNQYPSMMGIPDLRQAVANHNKRFYGLDVDWATETLVTSGATESLTASLLALIEPGDEVVLIEPLYDSYLPIIRLAGGVPKLVRIEAPDWAIPEAELRAAFGPKTKLILFNSPMNPTGKVFSAKELGLIAELVQKHDTYALCDEVYEHLVYDGLSHIPLMTLPGMRDRTIRVGSAGKTFSLTGWKIGYITASADLIQRIARAHQFVTFTTPPNLQAAVAYGLNKDRSYFDGLASTMARSRDRLKAGLERAGFTANSCSGTYFITADIDSVGFDGDDDEFCRYITREAGVTAIPVSAFYAPEVTGRTDKSRAARFCFCKPDGLIDEATDRLARHFAKRPLAKRASA